MPCEMHVRRRRRSPRSGRRGETNYYNKYEHEFEEGTAETGAERVREKERGRAGERESERQGRRCCNTCRNNNCNSNIAGVTSCVCGSCWHCCCCCCCKWQLLHLPLGRKQPPTAASGQWSHPPIEPLINQKRRPQLNFGASFSTV